MKIKKSHKLLLFVFSGLFLLAGFLFLHYPHFSPAFDAPDETANYFWIKHFAQTGELVVDEPLNLMAQNQIHPRSFNVLSDGSLVPGTFLGMILIYGLLAKIVGLSLLVYLPLFLAILAFWAFYLINKKLFNDKIALLATGLLFLNPVWWYYYLSPLYPNITFFSLLLFALYFLIVKQKQNSLWLFSGLAGLFFGMAMSVRLSELVWASFLILIIFIVQRKLRKTKEYFSFLLGLLLSLGTTFYVQYRVYGSWLVTGYNHLEPGRGVGSVWALILQAFAPFGWHFHLSLTNFYHYYFQITWPLLVLLFVGMFVFLQKYQAKAKMYLGIIFLLFFYLILFYGSMIYADPVILNFSLLGLSYVRYWLPLFVLILPLSAFGLDYLQKKFPYPSNYLILTLIFIILTTQSFSLLFSNHQDNLLTRRKRIASSAELLQGIERIAPPNSIIISQRLDKVLFPQYRTINLFQPLSTDSKIQKVILPLLSQVPIYYLADKEEKTSFSNFHLVFEKKVYQHWLYRIEKNN